jgi:pimeloyl-ACP methyl ester carboxylesterase
MQHLDRDGVSLAYEDTGGGAPPLLFVHGFCGNHTHFAPQIDYFRRQHRVIAVDRRGHGGSDKPEQNYTIAGFADDLAWLSAELGLYRPVVVVHSQGGIGLDLAARFPELAAGLILLDAPVLPPPDLRGAFQSLLTGLKSPGYRDALRGFAGAAFLPTDHSERKATIVEAMCSLPQHVIVSTWENFLTFDEATAAAACRIPILAIGSAFATDPSPFRALCPRLIVDQVTGVGHFLQLEAPDQVNAIIERFLSVRLVESAVAAVTPGVR